MKQKNANKRNNPSSANRNGNNRSGNNNSKTAVIEDNKLISKWWFFPMVFIIAVIPLIVIIHTYDCGLQSENWFSTGGVVYDFFLYYKAFFLRLFGIVILFMLAYMLPKKDHSFLTDKRSLSPLIAIGIFGLFSLASAILSAHTSSAFWGGYEQWEGWFIILVYIACFFMSFGYARTVELIRFLLDALLIGATIIGLLGTFQAMGLDWIQSDWAKPLITAEYARQNDMTNFNVKLNFGEGVSYVTLYNPNYVGSYVALVFPYMLYLIVKGEKIWKRILAVATSIMLIVTLLASQSLTGLFGLAAGTFLLGILLLPYLKKTRIFVIICMALSIVLPSVYMIAGSDTIQRLLGDEVKYTIDTMKNNKNSIDVIFFDGGYMGVQLDESAISDPAWAKNNTPDKILSLIDVNGKLINYEVTDGVATITEPGYPAMRFSFESRAVNEGQAGEVQNGEISLMHLVDNDRDWTFTVVDGEIKYFTDLYKIDDIKKIDWIGYDGHWHFASRRGYIWSRTNPMLTDNLLLGVGRDNFTYAFPNNDYVGKKYMNFDSQTITKPHNLFLQIWTQDGLPALLAFLFLYFLLLIRTIRLCYRKDRPESGKGITMLGFTIITTVAITSYILVGFSNDSTITVAPIFWCMLGAGYAAESVCSRQVRKD